MLELKKHPLACEAMATGSVKLYIGFRLLYDEDGPACNAIDIAFDLYAPLMQFGQCRKCLEQAICYSWT